jgi:hypothetical protein
VSRRAGAVLLCASVLISCSTSAPPSIAGSAGANASLSAQASASPTLQPTATPFASYTTTGDCSITLDQAPALDEKVFFSGQGFAPGTNLNVQFDGPNRDFVFPGEGIEIAALKTGADGTLKAWDVTFNGSDEVGVWTLTFTDGSCQAGVQFSVTQS